MPLKGLDHVAIAVEKLEPALEVYCKQFGWTNEGVEVVLDQQARVARLVKGPHTLELVEPHGETSTVRKFLEKRGPGLHHLCFEVEGLEFMLASLAQAGARLVDTKPRMGAGGRRIAFVHPASCGGVLIELSTRDGDPDSTADPDKPATVSIDVGKGVAAGDRLLNAAAVAELQGCSEEIVKAAIVSGRLPSQIVHGPSRSGIAGHVVRRSDAIAWRRER
jgi:methylmalonyl-CoA/ethylmalonyl-CoA epimerase